MKPRLSSDRYHLLSGNRAREGLRSVGDSASPVSMACLVRVAAGCGVQDDHQLMSCGTSRADWTAEVLRGVGWAVPRANLVREGQSILSRKRPHFPAECRAWNATARLLVTVLRPLLVVLAACTLAIANGVTPLEAQSSEATDINRSYTVKAAYLLQFGHYVEWPADAFVNGKSPLVIGILGPYPFGSVFEEVARTKRIEGRPVVIRSFASMADYTPCHILFIVASVAPAEKARAIEKLKGSPVLLVGEEPKFAQEGGIINFFIDESKVRFEINAQAARQDQLKIGSTLLSLAKLVAE